MAMLLTPDQGVPLPAEVPNHTTIDVVQAACETIGLLEENGLPVPPPTNSDKDIAAALVAAYANDPDKVSKQLTPKNVSTLAPAALLQTRAILDEFGHAVVNHAVEIRHLVTNKLLLESENPDPRIRIRALELLGKITDVGLFTERSEVTITHQSTDDLKAKLRAKLSRLKGDDVQDIEVVQMDGEELNIDAELGLEMPKEVQEAAKTTEEYDDAP
jgi:hypothetical protein